MVSISIINSKECKKQYKRGSRIRAFFEKIIDKAFEQGTKENGFKSKQEFIEALNEILTNSKVTITLSEEEQQEFQTVTRRDYRRYTDMTTLLENGTFTTNRYNAQILAEVLRDFGIKPPIRVYIKMNEEGKIQFIFWRPIND